jgi:hypothetical protein
MEDDGDCNLMSSPEAARALTAWSFCVTAELVAYSAFRRNFFSELRGRLLHGPAAEKKSDKKLLLAALHKRQPASLTLILHCRSQSCY